MDVTIQSQIQSPLVRTLQSIPSNSMNYLHGIPDNTPPFSKHTVKVDHHIGDDKDLNTTYHFSIPQGGHLSRMYLEYRMAGHLDVNELANTMNLDNPLNFGNSIEWVELRTHNSVIERLYPSSIVFQNASLATSDHSTHYVLQGTTGYIATDILRNIYEPPRFSEPLRTTAALEGTASKYSHQDYIIHLPFSMMTYLKDNFQTRMMEDLQIVVKMRPAPVQVTHLSRSGTDDIPVIDENRLDLKVEFLNFHENVEEVIRNENFKADIPASLLCNDYLKFRAKYKSKVEDGNRDLATYLYTVDLSCDALVTNMFITSLLIPSNNSYLRHTALNEYGLHFRLLSGSDVITEGSKPEYDGVEGMHYSTVTRQFQNEGSLPVRWEGAGTNIRLSLNNTDEFFDGGVSFQSLVSPTLEIRVSAPKTQTGFEMNLDVGDADFQHIVDDPTRLEFDVVLKRKQLLRIDGNTGKIQKSLES